MEKGSWQILSVFERLRDSFYDRLGNFLYRLFIEANNPFGATDIVEGVDSAEEVYIPHPYLDVYW